VVIRRVRFRQSGGFAGLVRGSEVAGDALGAADRRALERHVTAQAASSAGTSGGRDLVVFELEVDTDTGQVRLEFDEASVPDDLAALVNDLASRARPVTP
jgi:hypothetical protein